MLEFISLLIKTIISFILGGHFLPASWGALFGDFTFVFITLFYFGFLPLLEFEVFLLSNLNNEEVILMIASFLTLYGLHSFIGRFVAAIFDERRKELRNAIRVLFYDVREVRRMMVLELLVQIRLRKKLSKLNKVLLSTLKRLFRFAYVSAYWEFVTEQSKAQKLLTLSRAGLIKAKAGFSFFLSFFMLRVKLDSNIYSTPVDIEFWKAVSVEVFSVGEASASFSDSSFSFTYKGTEFVYPASLPLNLVKRSAQARSRLTSVSDRFLLRLGRLKKQPYSTSRILPSYRNLERKLVSPRWLKSIIYYRSGDNA